ncbi:uncharacterized protein LOC142107719 [Mixophyes fleayi]|uniref:uncharacterized protein LOC142107719 n=1 Tax=Mixophyes fleayi TaxID=3061075 RepID=UPI003F4D8FC5
MLHILALFLLCAGATAGLQCTVIPGNLKQVDAGAGKVYGVNDNDNIYHWENNEWKHLPGKLSHVTVGPAGVWGVNSGNSIYKWQNNNWFNVSGLLKQVDAGGNKIVSGVNGEDSIYCLNKQQTLSESSDLIYTNIEGSLKYYSCGPFGCWGVNSANNIYYRFGVTSTACQGSRWQQIEGSLVMVEVGADGSVYGVNSAGDVYERDGISAKNPIGTYWIDLVIGFSARHVTYDAGELWLLTLKGDIYRCETNDNQCTVMPGNLKQVDAGAGEVYGVNDGESIYHWVINEWRLIPGKLIHVTVGPAGVWGVNSGNNIYKWQDNNWVLVSGSLKQVDAGGNKLLSGANGEDLIYCLNKDQTRSKAVELNYIRIEGSLKYYSCGPFGCWGVNKDNKIYYRYDVTSTACQGSRWQQIPGSLVMVETGADGSVFGVNSEGSVYKRDGICANNPIGTSWTQLNTGFTASHVSYDAGELWLLTQRGDIYKCEVNV